MIRKHYPFGIVLTVCFVIVFVLSPIPARAQESPWDTVVIVPETGNWNFADYFLVTATVDVVLSWEIKCTEGGCFGREAEVVLDRFLAAGETIRVGWGPQCYRWQFDPIGWDHGYIVEPYPEVCALLTATPTDIPVDTPTPTETPVETEEVTPTPTMTETVVTTPPTTPGTPTPTVTGTIETTPPATPGTETATPSPTATQPAPPAQQPAETPRSQLIAVTGADLGTQNDLTRLFVSLGIVLVGMGLVRLGINRKR
jgi:hypothetical protein